MDNFRLEKDNEFCCMSDQKVGAQVYPGALS